MDVVSLVKSYASTGQAVRCNPVAEVARQVDGFTMLHRARTMFLLKEISHKVVANHWQKIGVADCAVFCLWNVDLFFLCLFCLALGLALQCAFLAFLLTPNLLELRVFVKHACARVGLASFEPAELVDALAVHEHEPEALLVPCLVDVLADFPQVHAEHFVAGESIFLLLGHLVKVLLSLIRYLVVLIHAVDLV